MKLLLHTYGPKVGEHFLVVNTVHLPLFEGSPLVRGDIWAPVGDDPETIPVFEFWHIEDDGTG